LLDQGQGSVSFKLVLVRQEHCVAAGRNAKCRGESIATHYRAYAAEAIKRAIFELFRLLLSGLHIDYFGAAPNY
jgi:hypothetical protein